ncbi:hypothetical protein HII12_004175 [Brettanomyces bruxellensis]|uniref:Peroxisomal membrane protein PEX14 n=1 Tax=Dekkera bruxellensis TaxID=5007 RepID=A0A7D9GZD8_DEKBR|nr:hypothetical protein HII12_004175 [Brettanomyces bruxellensis]VUG16487.1 PEX14 [Brettanomyces bruxellensis]
MASAKRIRQDMVNSAVTFLLDGTISDSPLAKKIEFLQSKGLTDDEVQEAIRQAQTSASGTKPSQQSLSKIAGSPAPNTPPKDYQVSNNHDESNIGKDGRPMYPMYYANAPQLSSERDWKDYLILGAATAGLMYGAYKVVRNYVVPKVFPASKNELEKDKESVDHEFKRVQSLLDKFDEDQKEFYKKQEAKSAKIDETMVEIDKIISKTNEKNLQNEETLKFLKLQVDNIKTALMKSLESQKQTIGSELGSLEKEVDDLKLELRALSTGKQPSGADFFTKSSDSQIALSSSSRAYSPVSSLSESGHVEGPNKKSGSNSASPDAYSNLKIPSPASVPSVNDILGKSSGNKPEMANIHDVIQNQDENKKVELPAWQKAALNEETSSLNDQKSEPENSKEIPSWQMNPTS